jgi:predicted metalloprotease with PDZ domain
MSATFDNPVTSAVRSIFVYASFLTASAFVTVPMLKAQCSAKPTHGHPTLAYTFVPNIDGDATTMHITLTVVEPESNPFNLRIPENSGNKFVSSWLNLKAISPGTTITPGAAPKYRVVHFNAGAPVVLSYDLQKDFPGKLVYPLQFHPLLYPTYFEWSAATALARPQMDPDETLTIDYDWTALPKDWSLATSFGAGMNAAARCQTFTGKRAIADQALFAGGDFRLHTIKAGARDITVAIRGSWPFTDDSALIPIAKSVQAVRAFWKEDGEPYFLVTLAPFEGEGSTDGTAYINAFWFFMGPTDNLLIPHIRKDLVHEAFHDWNPARMGLQLESQSLSEWFQEGVTDYYADVIAYRNGLIPATVFAQNMNRTLADYYQGEASPYTRGLVIALWLDNVIRVGSGGKQSLDNVMFDMVHTADQPLSEQRVLHTVDKYLTPQDRERLRAVIDHDAPLPMSSSLEVFPCMAIKEEEANAFDFGLDWAKSRQTKVLTGVEPDGPGYQAGLRDGQEMTTWNTQSPNPNIKESITIKDGNAIKAITYYPRKSVKAPVVHPETCATAN